MENIEMDEVLMMSLIACDATDLQIKTIVCYLTTDEQRLEMSFRLQPMFYKKPEFAEIWREAERVKMMFPDKK